MTDTLAPTLDERADMRRRVLLLLQDMPRMGIDSLAIVEHGYEAELLAHEADLSRNPSTGAATLVILHPTCCGCDALTYELVWHG